MHWQHIMVSNINSHPPLSLDRRFNISVIKKETNLSQPLFNLVSIFPIDQGHLDAWFH